MRWDWNGIEDIEPVVHRVAAKYLRALSTQKRQPTWDMNGICANMEDELMEHQAGNGYTYCSLIFQAMGLDANDPLAKRGASYHVHRPWEGEQGDIRRAFCAEMADFIEQNYL